MDHRTGQKSGTRQAGKIVSECPFRQTSGRWLSACVPAVVTEAFQHAIEIQLGMYVVGDGIAPGPETWVRTGAAVIKVMGFFATATLARKVARSTTATTRQRILAWMVVVSLLLLHHMLNQAAVGASDADVIILVSIDCVLVGVVAASLGFALQGSAIRRR